LVVSIRAPEQLLLPVGRRMRTRDVVVVVVVVNEDAIRHGRCREAKEWSR
jgi:hypothetical protein